MDRQGVLARRARGLTIKKLQTLAPIAADLRQGQHFNITRLTILKDLCADPKAAATFARHIAKLTRRKMKFAKSAKQQRFARLIAKSAPMMEEIAEFWGRHFLGRAWRKKLEG